MHEGDQFGRGQYSSEGRKLEAEGRKLEAEGRKEAPLLGLHRVTGSEGACGNGIMAVNSAVMCSLILGEESEGG